MFHCPAEFDDDHVVSCWLIGAVVVHSRISLLKEMNDLNFVNLIEDILKICIIRHKVPCVLFMRMAGEDVGYT